MGVKVKQRKGKWWIYIDHKGRRKAKCVGDERTAKAVAEKIRAKITLGPFGIESEEKKAHRPFDTYFRGWLETYVQAHCKESTLAGYETAYRLYLLPRFGNKDISEIRRKEVKDLAYEMLTSGKSRSYVKATLAPLSEMFSHAIEDDEDNSLTSNPALRILRRMRNEHGERRRQIRFLTREEVSQLLDRCRQHFSEWYTFVLCLVRTGMRIGEAVGLQLADMNQTDRWVEVRRSISKGRISTPKSGKTRRVDLSAQATRALKSLLVERKKETLQGRWKEMPPWIFINQAGNPLDADNFRRRVWPKILAKAELGHIRIHDLRHTYASLLIAQGESLAYIRDQMGHHSIRVTVDIYGHLVPGGNRAAVDRLDDPEGATIRNPSATSGAAAELSEC